MPVIFHILDIPNLNNPCIFPTSPRKTGNNASLAPLGIGIDITKHVSFFIWTKENPEDYDIVMFNETLDEDMVLRTHFDPTKPVKFIVHGYGGEGTQGYILRLKDAYLGQGKLYYVTLKTPCYITINFNYIDSMICVCLLYLPV